MIQSCKGINNISKCTDVIFVHAYIIQGYTYVIHVGA